MYVVFARKYRPQRFEDVVGQDHITRTLQNAVSTGRVAHAYLFCGSRGVGKTTVARLLAKALNCKDGPTSEPCCECESCRRISTGDDMDVMEIDGASNRGIDEVRDLRRNVRLAPSHSRFKIYYIDEVHMLTGEAFNALLKTLEEPPEHVKFIFSTTDPQRLPETVRSRCQRFDFRRISDAGLVDALRKICEAEDLQPEDGVLQVIARAARGGMRDAQSALDQLASFGQKLTMDDALAVLGAVDRQLLGRIVDALAGENTADVLREAHAVLFAGTDCEDFADQLSEYLRDLIVANCCGADDPMLAGAMADAEMLSRQAGLFSPEQLTYMIQLLREAKLRARRDTTGRISLELALIKMSRLSDLVPVEQALQQLDGGPAGPAPAAPRAQGNPGESRSAGTAPGAPVAPANAAAAGRLRRMRESLKNGRKAAPAAATAKSQAPEGVDDVRYRQLMSVSPDPELVEQAMAQEPLRKAFAEADGALGLAPVRLERVSDDKQDDGADETAQAPEDGEE